MYDALVFDLDGTLWDSTASVSEAWTLAVTELKEELPMVSAGEVAGMMGMTIEDIFQQFFPQLPKERWKNFSDKLLKHQRMILNSHNGVIYPGVSGGLKKLAAVYPLYIVSNCHEPYLSMFFEQSGLESVFKDWECYGRTGQPKADNLKTITSKHQFKRAAYVGDTAGDQIASVKAGMDFYHAAYGFGEPDSDCMQFRSFDEVTQFFLGLA